MRRERKPVMRGAKMHWTQEAKRELIQLATTHNLNQLARHFRRTPSAILAMACKLNVSVTTKKQCPMEKLKNERTGQIR